MRAGRKRAANNAGACRGHDAGTAERPAKRNKHEDGLRDTESLKELAKPFLLAIAKMPLDSLDTKWSVGTNRRIVDSHVRELCDAFRTNGVQRCEPKNRLLLLCSAEQVRRVRTLLEGQRTEEKEKEKEKEDFRRWAEANEGNAEAMAGQHRMKALREFAREVGSMQERLWWTCELYDRDRLPRELAIRMRMNRSDLTLRDSYGQIWMQLVSLTSSEGQEPGTGEAETVNESGGNGGLLVDHKLAETLGIGAEHGFPTKRLVTLWLNKPWRDKTTLWCRTRVGLESLSITLFGSLASQRLDEYWFQEYQSTIDAVESLPVDTQIHVSDQDWDRLAAIFGSGKLSVVDAEELFYKKGQRGSRSRATGLLSSLDDDEYGRVCEFIKRKPSMAFPAPHRILRVYVGYMGYMMYHIIAWIDPASAAVASGQHHSKQNKTLLRVHLEDALKAYADAHDEAHPTHLTATAVRLQKRVLDFTRERADEFRDCTIQPGPLSRQLGVDEPGYEKRFCDAVWQDLLQLVRTEVPLLSGRYPLRPGWMGHVAVASADTDVSVMNDASLPPPMSSWQDLEIPVAIKTFCHHMTTRAKPDGCDGPMLSPEGAAKLERVICDTLVDLLSHDARAGDNGRPSPQQESETLSPLPARHRTPPPEQERNMVTSEGSADSEALVSRRTLDTTPPSGQTGAERLLSAAARFIEKVLHEDLTPADALRMLHEKNSIDFGSTKAGGRPAKASDKYAPSFHLDFLSIVGKPGLCISERNAPILDNFTMSFHNWAKPYGAKHVGGLHFNLTGRTFYIAEAATRESWFIVMHPIGGVMSELPTSAARRREQDETASAKSGLPVPLARQLGGYITSVFQIPELVGRGVEPCWRPGSRHSQRINSDAWALFQEHFMDGWPDWSGSHAESSFWRQHMPAFHAYDYGANIEIPIHPALSTLTREKCEMSDDEDSDREDEEEAGSYGSQASAAAPVGAGQGRGETPTQPQSDAAPPSRARGSSSSPGADTGAQGTQANAAYGQMIRESEGLRKLNEELSARFRLNNIAAVSYALAVCIHTLAVGGGNDSQIAQEDVEGGGQVRCLLIDRNQIAREYRRTRDYTFYSQAFSPLYGNVSSREPPAFLHSLLSAMQGNVSIRNDGADVLSFGYFQGYSNIKRAVRHSAGDLLATKGYATAGLTVPTKDACLGVATSRKREKALRIIRGQETADAPEESTPFARERRQLDVAIEASEVPYRLEQVVSLNTARLLPRNRTFDTVLRTVFQLMRFFARERESYIHIFRSIPIDVFPTILGAYARVFELALAEMEDRYTRAGEQGLDMAQSEGVAVIDRLGGYMFSGFDRHLPKSVLRPLGTIDSLRTRGWPYIDSAVLDLDRMCKLDVSKWPRSGETGRLLLLHVAELRYHYGERVASSRAGELLLAQMGHEALSRPKGVAQLVKVLLEDLWVPQTRAFMTRQIRRRLHRAGLMDKVGRPVSRAAIETCDAAIGEWDQSKDAFAWASLERLTESLLAVSPSLGIDVLNIRTRYDCAADMIRTTRGNSWESLAPKGSTWPYMLHEALRSWHKASSTSSVSEQDWISLVTRKMSELRVEWVPGTSGGRISSTGVVRIQGQAGTALSVIPAGPPGSLRRAAQEADIKHQKAMFHRSREAEERGARHIYLGTPLPFTAVPALITQGFSKASAAFAHGDPRVLDHYHLTMNALAVNIDDSLCQYMLLLVLTICSSTETPFIEARTRYFSILTKRKDPAQVALALVTKMAWFLYPKMFPWTDSKQNGPYNVLTMGTKIEHIKTCNNRMLRQLGWVNVSSSRDSPRTADMELRPREELLLKYVES
ncbi:hypothetical protein B0I35DRAFT_485482 [Stachybotrys elegans]|uniref:Uncharacterized protein n=1 Tax=Stachybotrys elegans TaxID=80388 RepID=A0A8K0SCA2_9HYPO|nr:hypothetical protein B0I35DRAFT_485482 [Stachybotrys elegans]